MDKELPKSKLTSKPGKIIIRHSKSHLHTLTSQLRPWPRLKDYCQYPC